MGWAWVWLNALLDKLVCETGEEIGRDDPCNAPGMCEKVQKENKKDAHAHAEV